MQAQAEEVAGKAVAAYGVHDDAWINGYSRELSRELGQRGWIGMTWPAEHGGGGRTALERFVVTETLIEKGAPIAASWFADRQMGPTLIAYGSEDQKQRFLPGILAGETGWCIGMSEPNAGSDLASLTTKAERDGDTFVINGQKMWTSFGDTADYCYLICRTSNEGPPHAGISEVIVPLDSPGITIRPIEDMTTNRHFCEVWYEDVRVPVENLVGAEGGSWKQTMRQLEHERGGIDRLLSNHALYLEAKATSRHDRPARPPGPGPRSRPATGSGVSSCCARRSGRRPARSRRPRRPSAPSTSSGSPTSPPARSAPRPCSGAGSPAARAMRPPTRSWAGRRTCSATSSASAYSGLPREPG